MARTGFSRVRRDSDKPGHGARALVVCGYGPGERETLLDYLGRSALAGAPVVFADTRQAEWPVAEVFAMAGASDSQGADSAPVLPRAVILAGLSQAELCAFMDGWKTLGLPPQLWAVLTPVSERWSLSRLLRELDRERRAMAAKRGRSG